MKKIVIAWVVCVLGLVGLFAWVGPSTLLRKPSIETGEALVKAEFTLQHGTKTVNAVDLRGQYLLVYFGFTHCPDICPTSLLLMNNAIDQLGANAKKVTPVFISIDPERDTPEITAEYATRFGPRVLGLSGTPDQVRNAADHFKVYYSKVDDTGSALGYVMDHSGFIYLMDPNGKYLAHFPHNTSEQELKQELVKYVK